MMGVDIKKVIIGVILVIVLILVYFNIVGSTATDIQGSADSITDANNCSLGTDLDGIKLTYNITDKFCYNSTIAPLYLAGQFNLPLNSLFGRNSVIILSLMAGLFIVIMFIVLKGFKGKDK